MTAKEILKNYKILDLAISNRLAEIERLEARATRVSASSGSSQGGGTSDKVGITAALLADEREKLKTEIAELMELKKEADRILLLIPDMFDRELVRMRYILGYTYEAIAEKSFYCCRAVMKKIKAAVENVQ